ncbi:MAG: 1-acyl-sn-glycerol-3-phosphate acyltransferase [Deltaproteobacteria bacterium]|nr:1-acyl-sn-glycerol-3-phosphate acyltransferase [Deltaproteobacteria bacterium]
MTPKVFVYFILAWGKVVTEAYYRRVQFWWLRLRGRPEKVEEIILARIRVLTRFMFNIQHCQVWVEGLENVPPSGPLVMIANHQSMYDNPLMLGYMGRKTTFLAKKELWRVPGLGYWMTQMNCRPINRQDKRSAKHLMVELGHEIHQSGEALVVFPEGTRTKDPDRKINPFKHGFLRLTQTHNIPILPVCLDGTRLLNDSKAMARTKNGGRVVRVKILPPIYPPPEGMEEREFINGVRDTIIAEWEKLKVDWPVAGEPPGQKG